MVVLHLKNYLTLLKNDMDIVYFANTKYNIWQIKEILIVHVIVYI